MIPKNILTVNTKFFLSYTIYYISIKVSQIVQIIEYDYERLTLPLTLVLSLWGLLAWGPSPIVHSDTY